MRGSAGEMAKSWARWLLIGPTDFCSRWRIITQRLDAGFVLALALLKWHPSPVPLVPRCAPFFDLHRASSGLPFEVRTNALIWFNQLRRREASSFVNGTLISLECEQ
jgi:hypothetical protein